MKKMENKNAFILPLERSLLSTSLSELFQNQVASSMAKSFFQSEFLINFKDV